MFAVPCFTDVAVFSSDALFYMFYAAYGWIYCWPGLMYLKPLFVAVLDLYILHV